jgi:hypothetical protein
VTARSAPKCVAVSADCDPRTGSFEQVVPPKLKEGYSMRRTYLTTLCLLPIMAASVLLANCSSPTVPPGPTGTLTGTLQAVGRGAPGDGPRALAGQVTLHGPSGHLSGITVSASGRFSVPVPVGTYTVSGLSPQHEGRAAVCRAPGPVVVTKGVTSHVEVDCRSSSD